MALRSRKQLERQGRSVPDVRSRKERDWDDTPPPADVPVVRDFTSVFDPERPLIEHDEAVDAIRVLFAKGPSKVRWVASRERDTQRLNQMNRFFDDEPPGTIDVPLIEHNMVVSDIGDTHLTAKELLAFMKEEFLDRAMAVPTVAMHETVVVVSVQMQHDPASGKLTVWYGVGIDPSVGARL